MNGPWCNKTSQQTFVLKTSFVFVFRRRLDQDEYVRLSLTSSEDVFKTSWPGPIYTSWPYIFKTSSRRYQDIFKTSCKNILKTSSTRLLDILKTSSKHLQESVFKTSSRRLENVFKTSSRGFEDVFKTSCKDLFKTFSRRIIKLNCSC